MDNEEPNKDESYEEQPKKNISIKKKIIWILSIVLIIFAGIGTFTVAKIKAQERAEAARILAMNQNVENWSDKVYPGVTVYGLNLEGKTKDEVIKILNEQVLKTISNKVIEVKVGENLYEFKYENLKVSINDEEIIEKAMAHGKSGTLEQKDENIKNKKNMDIEVSMKYDMEVLDTIIQQIYDVEVVEPTNATITINFGNITTTPDVSGMHINKEDLHKKLVEIINKENKPKDSISINLEEKTANVTLADLQKIDGKIASFTGGYSNDGTGRTENLRIATQYINGTLLMPGEEFSYNRTIGETTPERGYQKANIYVASGVEEEYGGGVCQISTYLYRAAMRANLKSSLRYPHSMMVSYSEAGLDATVYEGDIDYRFVNTYDFPIYIEGAINHSNITFNIYGNLGQLAGKSYDMVSEVLEKYDFTTQYVDDNTLPRGSSVVRVGGAPGYKSNAYLITYQDGVEINRELISTDIYQPLNTVIARGTGN